MERGSSKHGPRLDEELDHDTRSLQQGSPVESRAEEERLQEGDGETGPTPDEILETAGTDPDVDLAAVEARSQLARWLRPSAFPADRGGLLDAARGEQAPETIIEALERLPDGVTYDNVEQVWEALGGQPERRF
jgi:hypothetical protein